MINLKWILSQINNRIPDICVISDEKIDEVGEIEPDKDHVREEPYSLPSGFEWDTIDLGDKSQVIFDLNYTLTLLKWFHTDPELILWV